MTTAHRSAIKGTFAIYSGNNDRYPALDGSDRQYSVTSPVDSAIDNRPGHVSAVPDVDPLVLVVQLKKELDDERRRADRVQDEMQVALASAQAIARREADQLREAARASDAATRRAQDEAEEERGRRVRQEEESTAERRRLKDELERAKSSLRQKESDLEEAQERLDGQLDDVRSKLSATQELLRKEQAARASRESLAERKFAAIQHKLKLTEDGLEAAKAAAAKYQIEHRKEMDEAHLRHSDTCQQLLESEQVRSHLVDENARLIEDLEATLAANEQARARLRSEFEARLDAEMGHAEEERTESVEELRRSYRGKVKQVEADYRARLDEAKQRLTSILRSKKSKYESRRAELEEKVEGARKQLQRSEAEKEALRARLARLLGRASGLIENHCSTTKRLIADGRDSAASLYSAGFDEDRASLASESWSLPNGPRPNSPPQPPPSVPELDL